MTFRILTLELTAQNAAVFSRSAATATTHMTATYPQGANLLGWAAEQLYEDFDKVGIASTVFHSGKVRFSDAVRLVEVDDFDSPTFPNPAILLEPKHQGGDVKLGRAIYDKCYNQDPNKKIQAEAIKGRLVTLTGTETTRPILKRRLRTATLGGVAADAQLFNYQSIMPGQTTYRSTIECDDDSVTDDQWAALKAVFEGVLQIGRGHITAYGGSYRCEVSDDQPSFWPTRQEMPASTNQLRLWLVSDAAFVDEFGSPILNPGAKQFGLSDEWKLIPSESASSSRRVWPWNGQYGTRDMEYAIIEAGSVFTFFRQNGEAAVTPHNLVGIGQERGFGRVAVMTTGFIFKASNGADDAIPAVANDADIATDLFITWLKQRDLSKMSVDLERWTDQMIAAVREKVKRAGREGPKVTQWKNLYPMAEEFGKTGDVSGPIVDLVKQRCWDENYSDIGGWVKTTLFANVSGPEFKNYPRFLKRVIDKAADACGDNRS
jgi:hypothetical protein